MKTLTLLPRTSNTGKKKYLSRHVQPQMNWNHICSEEEWRIVNRSSDVGAWASEQLDFPWTDFPTVCWEWKDHLDQIPVRKCTWVFNEILRLPRHVCLFRVLWGRTPLFQFNYFLQVVGFFFSVATAKIIHTHTHTFVLTRLRYLYDYNGEGVQTNTTSHRVSARWTVCPKQE